MAPSPITEDYYMILEVEQTATLELIVSSYRQLARKLHPDKNAEHGATEAFQKLGQAYETLKDESKRRAYDLIYPSLKRSRPSPQSSQTPRPPPTSAPQPEAHGEAAQIAAIQKSKQERSTRWQTKKNVHDTSIFEIQRRIRRLEQDIANLNSIFAAEAKAEAQKNSWGAWLFSSIYKKAEESEVEKERKDRARQERKIEKDMKERRLCSNKADLKIHEDALNKAKGEVDAADRIDNERIRVFQAMIRAREARERQEREKRERERQEKERQERERQRQERERQEWERQRQEWDRQRQEQEKQVRERMAKFWKQQQEQQEQREKRECEAAEALRKQQEDRAAERERRETGRFQRRHAHPDPFGGNTDQAYTLDCRHDGWWPKIQGRRACPECNDSWTYLLQCPGCAMQACPKCQAAIRPRKPRNTARTNHKAPPRVRTPSPDFDYHYDW